MRVAAVDGVRGVDSLANIERIHFNDIALAFDFAGNAGLAARLIASGLGAQSLMNPEVVGRYLRMVDNGTAAMKVATQIVLDALANGGLLADGSPFSRLRVSEIESLAPEELLQLAPPVDLIGAFPLGLAFLLEP